MTSKSESLLRRLYRVRRKLAINILPAALAVIFLTGLIVKLQRSEAMEQLQAAEINAVSRGVMAIARGIDHLPRDLRFLYLMNDIPSVVSKPTDTALHQIASIFIDFLKAGGTYSQARWIDADGMERLRVDHNLKWTWIVPDSALQMKRQRYYFIETMKLAANGIYISPMDLNIEHDEVVLPYEPTVRAALPVFDIDGERQGIFILNQIMGDTLALLSRSAGDHSVMLVDAQGYWLKGESGNDEWGHSRNKPELTLAVRHPKAWSRIRNRLSGQFEDEDGLWTFRRVELLPDSTTKTNSDSLVFPVLTVLSKVPAERLHGMNRTTSLLLAGFLVVVLIALFILSASQALAFQAQLEAKKIVQSKANQLARANSNLEKMFYELRVTRDELIRSEKLSALGLMVAGVAHEINTPLGAALVAVSKLQNEGIVLQQRLHAGLKRSDLDTFMKLHGEGIELTLHNLERAALLVKNFKQLASDRGSEEQRVFKLESVVKECWVLFKNPAKNAYVEFKIEIDPEIELDGYPGSLSQILQNLIDNALTHAFVGRASGCITISARPDNKPGYLCIDVRDNGIGMNNDTAVHIFDPFYTTRRGSGGMGLGLHLSHQIATLTLAGTLDVTSVPNEGTCFSLRVPMKATGPNSTAMSV
ncbi:MAG: sensor histidine kinase [Gammaproteobacteria bacterium]